MGQRSRKRRRAEAADGGAKPAARRGATAPEAKPAREPGDASSGRDDFSARYRARSEARNEAARARLEPLQPGERPRAVTIGALVALLLAVANVVFYIVGGEIEGDKPALPGVLSYTGLMLAAAYGQWRARYWAVLGMEALLGILIVVFSILLVIASNVAAVLVSLAVIVPAGALFWFLVKAMARIQMPVRE